MSNNDSTNKSEYFFKSVISIFKIIIIALMINIIIKAFLVRTYTVDSSSMETTLMVNDKVITEVVTKFFWEISPEVFQAPSLITFFSGKYIFFDLNFGARILFIQKYLITYSIVGFYNFKCKRMDFIFEGRIFSR